MSPEAEDWTARYAGKDTPWDYGRPHPELEAWLAGAPGKGARACVPGCGTAHDAAALAQAGWRTVALDLVADAPTGENRQVIENGGGELIIGDALAWQPDEGFDLFFEHTFFCALEPDQRREWGQLVRRSLLPGGYWIVIGFPIGRPKALGGPPFGYQVVDLLDALGDGFELLENRLAKHPIAKRSWPERWLFGRRT